MGESLIVLAHPARKNDQIHIKGGARCMRAVMNDSPTPSEREG